MAKYEKINYQTKLAAHVFDIVINQTNLSFQRDYHYHHGLEIILPIVGDVDITDGEKQNIVKAGNAYIFNSKVIHSCLPIFSQDLYIGYVFQISYDTLNYSYPNIDSIYFENSNEIQPLLLPILYEMIDIYHTKDSFYYLDLTNTTLRLLKILLTHALKPSNNKSTLSDYHKDTIISITKYIKDNYSKGINVESIAKEFNYSYGYLTKLFKESTGITILDYMTDLRLQDVKTYLSQSNKTIIDISELVGFANVKSLNRCFKEKYNMTPTQYRKHAKTTNIKS